MNKIQIEEWITPISDLNDLYFLQLSDNGILRILVTDQNERQHVIEFDSFVSYKSTDEGHCLNFWSIKPTSSWTFKVLNSSLFDEAFRNLETLDAKDSFEHYAIATWDRCIEVLADKEPKIKLK